MGLGNAKSLWGQTFNGQDPARPCWAVDSSESWGREYEYLSERIGVILVNVLRATDQQKGVSPYLVRKGIY